MGDFRVVIEGVGSHGCGRDAKDGEIVTRCKQVHCSDCAAAVAVELVRRKGTVHNARIEHWPVPGAAGTTRAENPGPIDDLLAGTRRGSFQTTPHITP